MRTLKVVVGQSDVSFKLEQGEPVAECQLTEFKYKTSKERDAFLKGLNAGLGADNYNVVRKTPKGYVYDEKVEESLRR